MKKAFAVLLCAVLLAASLSGCGNTSAIEQEGSESTQTPPATTSSEKPASTHTPSASPSTPDPEETRPPMPAFGDFAEAYAGYLKVLRTNEVYIRDYTWQQGDGPVALCDIRGNATPELVYLLVHPGREAAELSSLAYGHDYGTPEARIALIMTDVLKDPQAGGGVRYCLFTTTSDELYLYKSESGEPWRYTITRLTADTNPNIIGFIPAEVITRDVYTNEPGSPEKYAFEGHEISKDEYDDTTGQIIGDMSAVIVWSGTDDHPIWDKVATVPSLAMSYDDAIAFMETSIGDTGSSPSTPAPVEGDFTKEQAIKNVTAYVIALYNDPLFSEDSLANHGWFEAAASDKLLDDQPIYLVYWHASNADNGFVLAFADGTVIDRQDPLFSNYKGYFDIDINGEWPFPPNS